MTEHTPRLMALPLDTLDRTQARFRIQNDDYAVATELTVSRAEWEALGSPSLLFATLSAEVPQLPAPVEGPHSPTCSHPGWGHGVMCQVDCPSCAGSGDSPALGTETGGAL